MRRLHLWLGLSLGGLFALLGLTGSALVFYVEIDALLHPAMQQAHASTSAAPPDWQRALATLHARYPDKRGAWRIEVTGQPGAAIPARYYDPPETRGRDFAPMLAWLSPDGAHVLRRDFWGDTAMTWLYDLHYRLTLGKTGAVVVGYAGIGMVALLITGLAAWWPRGSWSKALRFKRKAAPARRLRDWHKLTGLAALGLLLMLAGTGAMLSLPAETDAVLGTLAGPPDTLPRPYSTQWTGRQVPIATALSAAHRALPHARLAWIEVPGAGNGAFRLRMRQPGDPSARFPHSFVWVDQYSGRVLAVSDTARARPASTIANWLHPLHDASVGGLTLRVLAVLAGLAPLALFITGWRRWRLLRHQGRRSPRAAT